MLNNPYKPTVTRNSTYSPYFVNRPIPQTYKLTYSSKHKKYKLLAIIIVRAAQRQLKETWDNILASQRKLNQNMSKIVSYSEKNMNLSLLMAFDKIKRAACTQKGNQKLLKNVIVLLQRMERYKLKAAFSKLVLNSHRQNANLIKTFYERRNFQFGRKIQTLFKRHKKQVMNAMFRYAKFVKSYSKVRVIAVIHHRFQKQLKQTFFSRLSRFQLSKVSKGNSEREVSDLKVQLQDMTVQLENKTESIQRLEDELQQIKVEQSNVSIQHNLTYGEAARNKRGSFKSSSQRKIMSVDNRSQNDSTENILLHDLSIGSLLGTLNKSRNGSQSKFDMTCQCTCGLKSKYLKYKSLNQSLKNQLEIVKEELEVAKDLNEHFTNQIKDYLTQQNSDGVESLKKEHKLLLQERDQLRDKVFKYQKQISNLKSEFKFKMEEIYRKVRKGNI